MFKRDLLLTLTLTCALFTGAQAVSVPASFSATPSGYTIRLQWNTTGAYAWILERSDGVSAAYTQTLYSSPYTDSNLTNNTVYTYRIRAVDSNNNWSAYSSPISATVQVTVAAPQFTQATSSGYRISVRWTTGTSISTWELQRRAGNATYVSLGSFYSASYDDTNVTNGVSYTYRVRARDVNWTWSPWSAEIASSIQVVVVAPANLTASGTLGAVNVSWSTVAGAYRYEIWRSGSASGTYVLLGYTYSPGYSDGTVASGVLYYYKVRASDNQATGGSFAGPVSAGDMTYAGLGNSFPESAHPYSNYTNQTLTYTGPPDAQALDLTFDSRTYTEPGYDFITVLNGAETVVAGPFSGAMLSRSTIRVIGNTARIRLQADYSVTGWGFALTSITAVMPPAPPPPVVLKPSPNGTVGGALIMAWSPVSAATSYKVEWSSNLVSWFSAQIAATSYSPDLPAGQWYWRVSSSNGGGLGNSTSATPFTLTPGYAMAVTDASAAPDRLNYRVSFQSYRNPIAAPLSVVGLPAGLRWSFTPAVASGTGSSVLQIDGASALTTPGQYSFSVLAGTVPVDGGQGVFSISGLMSVTEAHAYPNPSRGQTVRLRAALTMAPTELKLRLYDLSGAPVLEISESAPFPSFTAVNPTTYEYAWTGRNGSGHTVVSEKYLFWFEARSGSAAASSKGMFTYLKR